jgi:hypothetical protein
MTRPQEENGTTTADRKRGVVHTRDAVVSLPWFSNPTMTWGAWRRWTRDGIPPGAGWEEQGQIDKLVDGSCEVSKMQVAERIGERRCDGSGRAAAQDGGASSNARRGLLAAVDVDGRRLVGIRCACVGDDQTSEQQAGEINLAEGGGRVGGPDVEREAMRLRSRARQC